MTATRRSARVRALSALTVILVLVGFSSAQAATYYISSSKGNDSANGQSEDSPWKSFAKASAKKFAPGDKILLKRGDTWDDCLSPKGEGTPKNPIFIGAYGKGNKPLIDRKDEKKDLCGIRLDDQGGFKIVGLEFAHCQTGIYAEYSAKCPLKKYIWIEDCYFRDAVYYDHYERYPTPRKISLGICFFSYERKNRIVIEDIMIKNCLFRRVTSAIWTNSPDNFTKYASNIYNFKNLNMIGCRFLEGRQWQQGIRGVDTGSMRDCVTHDTGRKNLAWNGVAGSMFFRSKNWIFEDSEWGFVSIGGGSGDGEAFDWEGNCDKSVMRRCLFHDTDGPGFLICCYASDPHVNKDILMEDCVINGKSPRPIGLPRCEIMNTTDWAVFIWKKCRFYLSRGSRLMHVADPEKDKNSDFVDCEIVHLSQAAKGPNLVKGAKTKASSGNAAAAIDGNKSSAWTATSAKDQYLQIALPSATEFNVFRLTAGPGGKIVHYEIKYWDARKKKWRSCFNGRNMGKNFIAPIVTRKSKGVRIYIHEVTGGNPSIAEVSIHMDKGSLFNDEGGLKARGLWGK